MKFWPFKSIRKNDPQSVAEQRALIFPKGTVVKFNGIPCELLQDTPYESAHFRAKVLPNEQK